MRSDQEEATNAPASTLTLEGVAIAFLAAPALLGATLFRHERPKTGRQDEASIERDSVRASRHHTSS